jgi:hypothetical protein
LCPENSVYDGYTTEKLIDAYAGGTLPLYSGALSVRRDFNEYAFLNYQRLLDMRHYVDSIKGFDTAEQLYRTYYEQPLLEKEPKLDDAIAFVRNIVK